MTTVDQLFTALARNCRQAATLFDEQATLFDELAAATLVDGAASASSGIRAALAMLRTDHAEILIKVSHFGELALTEHKEAARWMPLLEATSHIPDMGEPGRKRLITTIWKSSPAFKSVGYVNDAEVLVRVPEPLAALVRQLHPVDSSDTPQVGADRILP